LIYSSVTFVADECSANIWSPDDKSAQFFGTILQNSNQTLKDARISVLSKNDRAGISLAKFAFSNGKEVKADEDRNFVFGSPAANR
jgi:hypothetical protein